VIYFKSNTLKGDNTVANWSRLLAMPKNLETFKNLKSCMLLAFCVVLSGCLQSQTKPEVTVDRGLQDMMPKYDGPRAVTAVTDFSWSVGGNKTTFGIAGVEFSYSNQKQAAEAAGLRDMLTTAMFQSGRFRVLERQNVKSLKKEIGLSEDGYTDDSGIQRGGFKGAELVVMAAITGWEPGTSGGKGNVGALLGNKAGALLGAVSGGYKKSSMAMDIRIVDAKTSELVAATSLSTTSKDVSIGGALAGFTGGSGMGGGLSAYAKTPMEKAIRTTILEAAKYIAENTPETYLKH